MKIQYIGEHLLVGEIGKFLVLLAFFTALFSAIYYYMSGNEAKSYSVRLRNVARKVFILHAATVFGISITLYILIFKHYFEYAYVWRYSSVDLAAKYIVSCFWAGQEGSFIIWALWQAILGMILIFTAKKLESPVMGIVSVSQVFLSAALLGLHWGNFSIGNSPFVLLRNSVTNAGDVFFQNPNYLKQLINGQGLNPLLENPWMVIHPPLLFLGYAAALIPFAFAFASLYQKDYFSWIKPTISWTLFALFTLGGGIMLGGGWAYESLTFGGFWSWDPVENTSLVPWIILLIVMHLLLISKKQQQSLLFAYLFSFLGYIAVLYASYLTRSGVLAESSAHSFGNEGFPWHLTIFLLSFISIAVLIFILRGRKIPHGDKEKLWSKEFITFLASVIIFLSAFQIIVTTSIPLFNKMFGTTLAPPADRVVYYNTWQLPFVLLIAIFIGISQVLIYGKNDWERSLIKIIKFVGISILLTIFIVLTTGISGFLYFLLLFSLLFALLLSLTYLVQYIRLRKKFASTLTHTGFLIFLTGVLLAFAQSRIISQNTSGISMGDANLNQQNQVLIQNHTIQIGEYFVKYNKHEVNGKYIYYLLDFYVSLPDSTTKPKFTLSPCININPQMGNVHEPSTKHFLNKDIYVYISFADVQSAINGEKYAMVKQQEVATGDTIKLNKQKIILNKLKVDTKTTAPLDALITAEISYKKGNEKMQQKQLIYHVLGDSVSFTDAYIDETSLKIRFEKISERPKHILLGIYERNPEYIVIKAIVFPNILMVWVGAIVTFAGFCFALWKRVRNKKNNHLTYQ